MPDWSKSMAQTFEYYIVDPGTWGDKERIDTIKSCTISRDLEADTLGSATFDMTEDIGECYIRVYLITIQNDIKEKHPLGTFLVQTPSSTFDGKITSISVDAYTPLLELKENPPPLGYSILKGDNIMNAACNIVADNLRAPVIKVQSNKTLHDHFIANNDDTWLTYVRDLLPNADYELRLDDLGRILFSPTQKLMALQPIHTFDSGNSSILKPEISTKHDIYNVPNVVEVIYSNGDDYFEVVVSNDDRNSPLSTINRGRKITYRDTNPSLSGIPTREMVEEYAEQLLENLSSVEYTVSYTHGYYPVHIGDCVILDHPNAGLSHIKAKIISQSIKCEPGCPVSETAIYTKNLWR